MKGLFQLGRPQDLLAKLRYDLERLKSDHVNAYAAFDFFITARHLPEWLYPGDTTAQKAIFENSMLMQVCQHVADGSKHFQATAKHHNSVKHTSVKDGAFQPGAFASHAFQVGHLILELDGDAAVELGSSIEVRDLAEHILKYWEGNPDLQ